MARPALSIHRARHRGLRDAMEDRDVVVQRPLGGRLVTLLGVFDGHGGSEVAEVAASRVDGIFFDALGGGTHTEHAFRRAYADIAAATATHVHTGSTACTAALIDARPTAAWIGDSQLVVVTPRAVRFVSVAHRVDHPRERARVVDAGAEIEGAYVMHGDHGLMVTRAFGDTWFHEVGLIATPAVEALALESDTEHLIVLATDGLWDVLAPGDVMTVFQQHARNAGFDYARTLVDLALAAGTRDNVTVITAECVG